MVTNIAQFFRTRLSIRLSIKYTRFFCPAKEMFSSVKSTEAPSDAVTLLNVGLVELDPLI